MQDRPGDPDPTRGVTEAFVGKDSPYCSETRSHVADLVPPSG